MWIINQIRYRKGQEDAQIDSVSRQGSLREILPRKRKKNSALHFAIAGLVLVLFNVTNLQYSHYFSTSFPLVDIVEFLQLPNTVSQSSFPDELLLEVLKDVYTRREETYLRNINSTTIIVKPILQIDQDYISLTLKEGYFIKSHTNEAVMYPHIEMHSSIKESSENMLSEGRTFIRKYLMPLLHSSKVRDFTDVPRRIRRLQVGNYCINLFSFLLLVLICVKEGLEYSSAWRECFSLIFLVLCSLMLVSLAFFNITISIMVGYRLPNTRSHFVSVLYAVQFVFFLGILIYYTKIIKADITHYISERSIRRDCRDYEPSSKDTSSIYSPSPATENAKSGGVPVAKSRLSSNMNSPFTQTINLDSSPIGNAMDNKILSNEGPLDPKYASPESAKTSIQNQHQNLIGAARIRQFSKSGIFHENSLSPLGSRSFSAPVFQFLGTGSTIVSHVEEEKILQSAKISEEPIESPTFLNSIELEPCETNSN
ncbi:hypothetical protein CLIB1423_05S06172 [[Candida] railenensis]|uniref:Uncharacterized protein n=1 Tax=[Candida] railenensis TaxID=45579 RepID=A0A9P0QNR1_9ASCO|nr:hypothetical protein CLIB1423_05S06172 [[Candida] railenensis]